MVQRQMKVQPASNLIMSSSILTIDHEARLRETAVVGRTHDQ